MGRTWYAFRVMLYQAWRDPLWALACIIVGPLRLGVHALKVFFFAALVTLVLLALVEISMEITNLKKASRHESDRSVRHLRTNKEPPPPYSVQPEAVRRLLDLKS